MLEPEPIAHASCAAHVNPNPGVVNHMHFGQNRLTRRKWPIGLVQNFRNYDHAIMYMDPQR